MDQSYADTSHAGARRTLVGLFDSADEADAAVRELTAYGIRREDIDRHARVGGDTGTATTTTDSGADEGWWESLKRLFMPDDDTHAYGEGIRRGGVVVAVHATAAENDRVIDILEQHGSVDLDARTEEWRSGGWTPGMTAAAGTTPDHAAASARAGSAALAGGTTPGATASAAAMGTGTAGEEVRIPVAHEELQIGKREVERGRVRIRAYVVQRPVSEQVALRQETVTVERQPARGGDVAGDPFQERSLEVRETAEEAVVSKTARVDEELVVRKGVEREQRTISDEVRETKVEVEDDRKTRPGAGTPPRRG